MRFYAGVPCQELREGGVEVASREMDKWMWKQKRNKIKRKGSGKIHRGSPTRSRAVLRFAPNSGAIYGLNQYKNDQNDGTCTFRIKLVLWLFN